MKIIRSCIGILIVSLLLIACNLSNEKENVVVDKRLEVLDKTLQNMKKYPGLKLSVNESNIIKKATTNEIMKKQEVSSQLEYVNEQQFHFKEKISTDENLFKKEDQNEIYSDGKQMYQTINNESKRTQFDKKSLLKDEPELDERSVKFLFSLERLIEDYRQVKMSEENGQYVLEYSLDNNWDIKYFYELDYRNSQKLTDTNYENKRLHIKIWVDKKTFLLKKVEEQQLYYKPIDKFYIENTQASEILGEIKSVVVPNEIKGRAQ
jgi:hypothetical protein